jgi:glycosyltransferase involved in cell wall biosynthesis
MSNGSAVVVIFPVLGRPHRVEPLLRSLQEATPEPHRPLFVATDGDDEEIAEVRRTRADLLVVPPRTVGDYAFKINTAYRSTDEPFLFMGADDVRFEPGWLTAALRRMDDPKIGIVGTNDLGNARVMSGEHATHVLIRRAYVDRWGTIDERGKVLCEKYPHEFVDDELVETAKSRDAWTPALDSIVEHLHPNWGKAPSDDLYAGQSRRMMQGRRIYRARRRLWARRRRS